MTDTSTFTITRTVDTPLERTWRAWTTEAELAAWFGPKGCPIFKSAHDFKVGGTYHYGIRFPTGVEIWGRWVFEAIDAPNEFSFIAGFSDPIGADFARNPWALTWPMQSRTIIRFKAVGDTQTEITLTATPHNSPANEVATFTEGHASMTQGWGGTFEQLADFLKQNPT